MSPVQAERRRPSWMRKAEPFEVSNAKGMNVCVCEPATGVWAPSGLLRPQQRRQRLMMWPECTAQPSCWWQWRPRTYIFQPAMGFASDRLDDLRLNAEDQLVPWLQAHWRGIGLAIYVYHYLYFYYHNYKITLLISDTVRYTNKHCITLNCIITIVIVTTQLNSHRIQIIQFQTSKTAMKPTTNTVRL